jgi:hypothetical protein
MFSSFPCLSSAQGFREIAFKKGVFFGGVALFLKAKGLGPILLSGCLGKSDIFLQATDLYH